MKMEWIFLRKSILALVGELKVYVSVMKVQVAKSKKKYLEDWDKLSTNLGFE